MKVKVESFSYTFESFWVIFRQASNFFFYPIVEFICHSEMTNVGRGVRIGVSIFEYACLDILLVLFVIGVEVVFNHLCVSDVLCLSAST